tara:strand:+ start:139 stop:825 length:687 start_codon:yes stop_codon:yes gene_type:complete
LFSFSGLLVFALLGLDNSVVSFNSNNTIYLQEELNLAWKEQDPAGKEIFVARMNQRLPEWVNLFKEAANQTDQHWTLLAAISYQESHWNPKAVSKTGVRGLMMLTQKTAKEVGITKRTDPKQSVMGGSIYFESLLGRFSESIPRQDRLWMTIAAYNLGFSYLKEARKKTQNDHRNANSWAEVCKTLILMAKEEDDPSMSTRINEAINYVQNIQLYYRTLTLNERNPSV